jgi:hypothetical protein
MSMKNSNYGIGNRTRDLPTCSAVPQLNAITRAPQQANITASYSYTIGHTLVEDHMTFAAKDCVSLQQYWLDILYLRHQN